MLIRLVLLIGSGVGLALAALSFAQLAHRRITKRFIVEPRASHVDWDAPRHHGGFLAKRSDLHSEDYFNNPPSLTRRQHTEPSVAADDIHNKRATAGQWENLNGNTMYHAAPVSWGGGRLDLFYTGKDRTCQ